MADDNVRVAVRVRPLLPREQLAGAKVCVSCAGNSQVLLGRDRSFTFDHVFDASAGQRDVYDTCVARMVDSFFAGYNTTIFAYGQTGTGKTYTMGTGDDAAYADPGIVGRVVDDVFARMAAQGQAGGVAFTAKVSYLEIHNEAIRDLLHPLTHSRNINIREDGQGGILVMGVQEVPVAQQAEVAELLESGNVQRSTAATLMNDTSSRSHSIFTLTMEQRYRQPDGSSAPENFILSKFHLVDLAGSERAKKTGATGARLKESVTINGGLLALGNVISCLGDTQRRTPASHVPYRDSKLTRLLQDSLGGNSRTLMLACVSPADGSLEETLNTLRYANRARNIRNSPVVNRDPHAALIAALRSELEACKLLLLAHNIPLADLPGVAPADPAGPSLSANPSSPARPPCQCAQKDAELEELRKQLQWHQQETTKLARDNTRLKDELFTTEWKTVELTMQLQKERAARKSDTPRCSAGQGMTTAKRPSDLPLAPSTSIAAEGLRPGPAVAATPGPKRRSFSAAAARQPGTATPRSAAKAAPAATPKAPQVAELLSEKAAVAARLQQVEQQCQRAQQQREADLKALADAIKAKEQLLVRLSRKEEQSQQLKRQYEKRIEGIETEKLKQQRQLSQEIQALHGQRAEMERRMEEQRREAEQAKQALAGRVAALLEHITVLDDGSHRESCSKAPWSSPATALRSPVLGHSPDTPRRLQCPSPPHSYCDFDPPQPPQGGELSSAGLSPTPSSGAGSSSDSAGWWPRPSSPGEAEATQQQLRLEGRLSGELQRQQQLRQEREEVLERRQVLQSKLAEHDEVVSQGLLGLQRRLQSIDVEVRKREAAVTKAVAAQQPDKAQEHRQALRQLQEDRGRYQQKYDQLQATVGHRQDALFQQNVAAELRQVEDRLDTLNVALDYAEAQIAALRAGEAQLPVGRATLSLSRLHTPTSAEEKSAIASPSALLDLQGVVHHYHEMLVDLRSREADWAAQAQEDQERIHQLETTIRLLDANHRRQLELAQQECRQLLRRTLGHGDRPGPPPAAADNDLAGCL